MDHLILGSERLTREPGFALVDRDAELARLVAILMRRRASSVILTGPGGVGTTALTLGLQAAKAAPDAPFDLVAKRFFWLDTDGLLASPEPSKSWDAVMRRLVGTGGAVLVIDDARDLIDGTRAAGLPHALNGLLAAIGAGTVQVVLETREDDLDFVLRSHSEMRERFTILPLDEPSGEPLRAIARVAADRLTDHHGVAVEDEAVSIAIMLTTKYANQLTRAQPERTISLLDRALSTYRMEAHRRPPGFDDATWADERRRMEVLVQTQREGETAIASAEADIERARERATADGSPLARGIELPEVAGLRSRISAYRTEVDRVKGELDRWAGEVNASLRLTADLVMAEFSSITGIPVSKLNENEREKLRNLPVVLGGRVYGQEEAVNRLADGIRVARIGRRGNAPTAYLFLGPSGVGKTELAKALAGALLDDDAALSRFDMSEYMEKHAVARLIGAPPGYEGFEAGGILTNLMRRSGFRVLLFDEIEKAHPDVFNVFLQVLSDGRLTDGLGRTVDFRDASIVMTTNIGQPHFLDQSLSADEAEDRARAELSETYRPEFLNRFAGRQNIVCFRRLGLDVIERIVRRELTDLDRVYGERGYALDTVDTDVAAFCRDWYDPRVGARGLPGFITANLEPLVVKELLDGRSGPARVAYNSDRRSFNLEVQK